jgi:predicted aconitase with swiveling domain
MAMSPAMSLAMTPLLPGRARGRVLKLPRLSLWGGIDPFAGRLSDPALPHFGESVKDRVLMIAEPVGSSSSSAVLLELLHAGNAPAAIVLGRADAIVGLGVLVAREMGWPTIPLMIMPPVEQERVTDGEVLEIRGA